MTLDGKCVIVTGGTRGIGQGIVKMFCDEGARVASIARGDHSQTCRLCGAGVQGFKADIGDLDQIRRVFLEIDEYFDGAPDILCNNAMFSLEAAFLQTTPSMLDHVLAVNVRGYFVCGQEAARRMVAEGKQGRIINITSTESEQAFALQTAYGAAKGAQRQLTKSMAVDLAPYGIVVNAVGPGSIQTEALAKQMSTPRIAQHDLERTPMGHWERPRTWLPRSGSSLETLRS